MNTNTRYLIIGAVSFFVVLTCVMYYALYETKYAVLMDDLRGENIEQIVGHLKAESIHYKVSNDGNKLLVEDEHIEALRSEFMITQLSTNNNVGFELFDNTDIGMTDFAQKLNHQRALQGELSMTISAFPEVKYARIHLVLPENKLFGKKDKSAKASVSLFLNQGMVLVEQQIKGIKKIVASSVPELVVENVIVSDQNGIVLGFKSTEEVETSLGSNRLALKQKVEAYFINKVQPVLEHMYGKNNALMTIDVDLQLDDIKMVKEGLLPREGFDTTGALMRRKESTVSNKASQSGSKGKNSPTNKVVELEYQYGKKIENITVKPGSIARISIGVLLPGDVDDLVKESVTNIVSMAVGLDIARGDEIKVQFAGNVLVNSVKKPLEQPLVSVTSESAVSDAEADIFSADKQGATAIENDNNQTLATHDEKAIESQYFYVLLTFILLMVGVITILFRKQKKLESSRSLTQKERQESYELLHKWLVVK